MKYLMVEGFEMHPECCFFIIDELIKNNEIERPEQAQEYIKHHKIENVGNNITLRNPDKYGMHFSFSKEIPHYIYK